MKYPAAPQTSGLETSKHIIAKNGYYYLLYGLVLFGLVALIVFLELIDVRLKEMIVDEGGPVEILSAVGYFICAAFVYALAKRRPNTWCIILILVACGLRELDMHQRFTTTSNILKLTFYLSPLVPVGEKAIGGAIVLVLLYCCGRIVKDNFMDFLRAMSYMEPYAIGVFCSTLFLMVSQSFDGVGHKLLRLGITVDPHFIHFTHGIEEVVEMGIPLMFIIATMAHCALTSTTPQRAPMAPGTKQRLLSAGLFGVGGSACAASTLLAVLGYGAHFSRLHVSERLVIPFLVGGALSGFLLGSAMGWLAPWQRSGRAGQERTLSQGYTSLDFLPVTSAFQSFATEAVGRDEGGETGRAGQTALHAPPSSGHGQA